MRAFAWGLVVIGALIVAMIALVYLAGAIMPNQADVAAMAFWAGVGMTAFGVLLLAIRPPISAPSSR